MRNSWYKIIMSLLMLGLLVGACKSKKAVASGTIEKGMKMKEVIRLHEASFPTFRTISGSLSVSYSDGKNSQTVPLSFRMEKDKTIWFSAPLGVAKVMITPEKASYYNRMDNTYFDGGFDYISDLLGFEVDFENLQNLLLGQSIYRLDSQGGSIVTDSEMYQINKKMSESLHTSYGIIPGNYRIGTFRAVDNDNGVEAEANFTYQQSEGKIVPATIRIQALENEKKTVIELDFSSLRFDSELNFPFKIPSGFKRIEAK